MAKRPVVPEDLLRLVFLSDPQTHPDGTQVLFQKKTIGDRNEYRTQLVSADESGRIVEWTAIDGKSSHGRWSPDGSQIAFLSGRKAPKTQIYRLLTQGGEASPLTDLPEGDFGTFRWSPDGRQIAFTFRERDPEWTEAAAKQRAEKGLSTPARIANSMIYRWDGEGFFLDRRHALYVVEIASGETRKIYEGCPWGHYDFDWAPDGKRLAVKRSFQKNLGRDPEDDRIVLLDLEGEAKLLEGQPYGYKAAIRWSPDGNWIAYLGNPHPEDHRGIANTELFVAPSKGGAPKRLTAKTDNDLEVGTLSDAGETGGGYLEWDADSKGLLLNIGWQGTSHLARVDLRGNLEFLTSGPFVVSPGAPSRDGQIIACLCGNPVSPLEAALIRRGEGPRTVTDFNGAWKKEVELVHPEEHWTSSDDGYPVHLWTLRPGGKGGKRRAAVLEVHGGPQAQYGWTYFHEFQVLASAGYTVVYSNPRGSKGYGASHCGAIAGSWGDRDWADIAAVQAWMKARSDIDSGRIGIMGGSYGGYMVNWAVGQTDDFRAAITDRCVSNLLSKALNSDYPYYPGTYWKGSGYGSLESNEDLWRSSPMAHFDRVKTPMLIIHSEGDLRCHIEQGEQVFFALQIRGIPSRMVRYPLSTSHGMSRGGPPDLRIHRLHEILRWWKKYL